MIRVSAILLAAGESRRMGNLNKLELKVNGQPLVRRTAEILLALPLQELIVVTGHQAAITVNQLDGLPYRPMFNDAFQQGQMSSVTVGLKALQKPCDAVFICLADLALLQPADLVKIIEALEQTEGSIVVPCYNGQRGNPVLIHQKHVAAILQSQHPGGCRHFIDSHPQLVKRLDMANDHVVFDLDTPEDYQRLCERLAR